MSDIFDDASDLEEHHRSVAIAKARLQKKELKITGFCLTCNERLEDSKRFCDAWCRDEYQRYERIAKIKGLK